MITHIVTAQSRGESAMNTTIGRRLTAKSGVSGRLLAAAVGIVATFAAPLAAMAQTAAGAAGLEEIVVTANKVNAQKFLEIPVSIQATAGEGLRQSARPRVLL